MPFPSISPSAPKALDLLLRRVCMNKPIYLLRRSRIYVWTRRDACWWCKQFTGKILRRCFRSRARVTSKQQAYRLVRAWEKIGYRLFLQGNSLRYVRFYESFALKNSCFPVFKFRRALLEIGKELKSGQNSFKKKDISTIFKTWKFPSQLYNFRRSCS